MKYRRTDRKVTWEEPSGELIGAYAYFLTYPDYNLFKITQYNDHSFVGMFCYNDGTFSSVVLFDKNYDRLCFAEPVEEDLIPVDWENDEVVGKGIRLSYWSDSKPSVLVFSYKEGTDSFTDITGTARNTTNTWIYDPGEVPVKKRKVLTTECGHCGTTGIKIDAIYEHHKVCPGKPKKLLAPALVQYIQLDGKIGFYLTGLASSLQEVKANLWEADEYWEPQDRDVEKIIQWPAIPNKDGFYEVPEEE